MPTVAAREQPSQFDRDKQDVLNTLIGERVIRMLGEPDNLIRVQVRHLWASNYRVNVLVGPDVTAAKVAYSYFLVADNDGNITNSIPTILGK